jgi:hypothetical protein
VLYQLSYLAEPESRVHSRSADGGQTRSNPR